MKKTLMTSIAAATLSAGLAAPSMADVSATAGFVTDYVYRGSALGDAGAYFSVDYEASGFYAGVWAIQDGDATGNGLEVDYYAGYGQEFDNGLNFSLGYTAYTYTYASNYLQNFEDEFGGSIGYKGFALSAYYGWDHNFDADTKTPLETYSYIYTDLSWSGEVFGAVIGHYASDLEDSKQNTSYNYAEISASGEVATLDMTLTVGKKFGVEQDGKNYVDGERVTDTGTGYIVLDVSKTFSL
ncbi:MAG: TorF family putative porin [Cellvibrionales bacterium]|nr:TorF family putative porin [Cellvibrionales bacterium]